MKLASIYGLQEHAEDLELDNQQFAKLKVNVAETLLSHWLCLQDMDSYIQKSHKEE